MIPFDSTRETVASGLKEHLGCLVIRSDQSSPAPSGAYITYTVTTVAVANNGTWQQHEDGKDRKMVRQIWSITSISGDYAESIENAVKAREWLEHTGRVWLKDRGITVQSTTDITNRDNFLTVEYQRKNGFDVVFYLFDEVDSTTNTTGYIENADLQRI